MARRSWMNPYRESEVARQLREPTAEPCGQVAAPHSTSHALNYAFEVT
jgi:hypothetical protein